MDRKGIVYGMDEATYHGGGGAELSSSGAKLLLESPAKFKHEVIDGNRVHRPSFDLGTAVHTKVLGVGEKFITYPEEHLTKSGNVSTSAATKAWAAELHAQGKVILSPDQAVMVDEMAEQVLRHPTARMLFERPGHSEVSVFDTFMEVPRRARFDRMPDEGNIMIDLKTTIDGSKAGFAKSAAKYGYHVQRGHYLHMLKNVTGREAEMVFVVVEKTAPYLVAVHRLNEQFAEMGEAEALDAVDRYRRGINTGVWPGYDDGITELQPPMFAIYDYQDKYESGEITL